VVFLTLVGALNLVKGGGAQRRVKGDVVCSVPGGARLNVAPVLAVGARAAAAAVDLARQPVERRIQIARNEFLIRLDFLAAFPPVRLLRLLEYILLSSLRRCVACVRVRLTGRLGQRLAFFSGSASSPRTSDST
jgi:hypothetical protein